MRRALYIVGSTAVLLVLTAVLYLLFSRTDTKAPQQLGEAPVFAPDFSLPDESGVGITLSEVVAQVRIVNFWASWSPYAREELPALVRLKKEYGDRIAILALNRDANPREGRDFLTSLALGDDLVFVYDQDDTYYKKVGGFAMPETLFLGKDEQVLAHVHGPMTYERMAETLAALLVE